MNKWQKEITRFAKWQVKLCKRKSEFEQHRNYTRNWAKLYNTFEDFKEHNKDLINEKLEKRGLKPFT